MKLDPSKIKKVLVIGLNCVGDTLLQSAGLANLRAFLPDAKFTLYTHPAVCEMLNGDPHWQRLVPLNRKDPNSPYKGLIGRWKLIKIWNRERYDLVIDLRGTFVPLFLNCKYKPLWNLREVSLKRTMHEAERCIWSISSLGVPIKSRDMRLYVKPEVARKITAELSTVRDKLIILNPGGKNFKQWPIENFVKLAIWLEEKGYTVGVIGFIPEEEILAKKILSELKNGLDFSGAVSSSVTGARLKNARLFISNDGGALHMASAVGTPVVALFGPTDPYRYGPWSNRQRVVYTQSCPQTLCHNEGVNCSIGRENCMENISVHQVKLSVMEMLPEIKGE